jgi:hypothetical protein
MEAYVVEVDKLAATWLRARQDATHQTTTQIIGELVREQINRTNGHTKPPAPSFDG